MSSDAGWKKKPSRGSMKLLWAAPFFLLALIVAFSGLSSDRAWPVAALLLVGIVIVVVPEDFWREALANVENASFGPVSVGLRKVAGEAAAIAEPDTSEGVEEAPSTPENVFDLRLRLEYKLAFIAKHMLARDGQATFVTIGSLKHDGYLRTEEARAAFGILSIREEELQELSDAEQKKFVKEAGEFVDGVRASVFWGQVRRTLQGADAPGQDDLCKAQVPSSGRRDDFRAGLDGK
jgi:hypothetical protein